MNFFSADTHFFHKNIMSHTGRPWFTDGQPDVEAMNCGLVKNWNSVVRAHDTVWFLGDFTFGKELISHEVFRSLKGEKHLVRGNHDPNWLDNFEWASVQAYKELRIEGERFILSHYPFEVWNGRHHNWIHLHGHSHGSLQTKLPRRMDVGVDCHPEFRPFSFEEVMETVGDERFSSPSDHHGSAESNPVAKTLTPEEFPYRPDIRLYGHDIYRTPPSDSLRPE